jgi:hypothetical protein
MLRQVLVIRALSIICVEFFTKVHIPAVFEGSTVHICSHCALEDLLDSILQRTNATRSSAEPDLKQLKLPIQLRAYISQRRHHGINR